MNNEINPDPKEISKLTLQHLNFSSNRWNEQKGWTCEARLIREDGYSGAKDLTIKLESEIAEKLMLAIMPFVIESASKSAQQLANDAKELINSLSQAVTKTITDKVIE